jgi:hypothetical protein
MTTYRFRKYDDPSLAVSASLQLVGIGMAIAVIWAGVAILKFVGWL